MLSNIGGVIACTVVVIIIMYWVILKIMGKRRNYGKEIYDSDDESVEFMQPNEMQDDDFLMSHGLFLD
jgi:hypothetical protein